jgi:hypothetical protein
MHPVVFESVNGRAHAALVKAKGNGFDKGRRGQTAGAAEGGGFV